MELTKERMMEVAKTLYERGFCLGDTCCKHCEKVQAVESREVIGFYNRVIELLQADADRRCVVLPCKVGEKLYILDGVIKPILEYELIYPEVAFNSEVNIIFHEKLDGINELIGKTVFLTREEAIAALKGGAEDA